MSRRELLKKYLIILFDLDNEYLYRGFCKRVVTPLIINNVKLEVVEIVIVELIDFVNEYEELMNDKTITQLTTYLYGYFLAPKKEGIVIKFNELSRILSYNPQRYWLDCFLEQYEDEEIAFYKFIEIVKNNVSALESYEVYQIEKVSKPESIYSSPICNAMAAMKHCPLLAIDIMKVEYLRTWLCGYITGQMIGNYDVFDKINWSEIILCVRRIIKEFDWICENENNIGWDRFFEKYNKRLKNYGLDLESIIQVKKDRKDLEGYHFY